MSKKLCKLNKHIMYRLTEELIMGKCNIQHSKIVLLKLPKPIV